MKKTLALFILTFTCLVSCGDQEETKKAVQNVKETPRLSGQVTGHTNEEYFDSSASLYCGKSDSITGLKVLEVNSLTSLSQNFEIKIPLPMLKVGTYQFKEEPAKEKVTLLFRSSKGKRYRENIDGFVTFTSIPTKAGEYLTGSVKASASILYKPEEKVEITMEINIPAGSTTFKDCQ